MSTKGKYPVMLTGELTVPPGNGWWLIKIFLAIPHLIILPFLWIGFVGATIIAAFAILFTAKYPKALFEFNIGVLRWSWRVGFYGLHAFGTDKYPPFSLDPDKKYPADLTIQYPARLSRGLLFVKWWLLVIPHAVIVAIFTAGMGNGLGLIPVLSICAAFALLFTGKYPKEIFRLVIGLNRWVFRVIAYAALMTDAYPPFRLEDDK
ncbi:MAG: DUF4389 domain-containing protein [Spirochaetota bacterium]